MKRFLTIVATLVTFVTTAWGAELPKTMIVGSPASEEPTFVVKAADRTVTVGLPLTNGQKTTEKTAEKITDPATVFVCASQMYVKSDGSAWVLQSEEDYCGNGQTTVVNGMITRTFKIPQVGDGENYAFRVWGKGPDGKWLWINQSSEYNRLSDNGSPGYEALINLKTGTVSPVPKGQPVRK